MKKIKKNKKDSVQEMSAHEEVDLLQKQLSHHNQLLIQLAQILEKERKENSK